MPELRRAVLGSVVVVVIAGCGGSESTTAPTPNIPCAVDKVMIDVCQTCHTDPPKNGALMPLVTYADTQAPFDAPPTYRHTPTWKVIGDVVESGWMPQPWPGVSLSAAGRTTILDWVGSGAPEGQGGSCP